MRDYKNGSSANHLSRFGRDKREQGSESRSEGQRPRSQRDAADSDQPRGERRSYNPNFSSDNRPRRGDSSDRRSFSDRAERSDRPARSERPERSDRSERRPYGDRPERKPYGSKPAYGERKQYGDRPQRDGEERRPYGDRPERKPYGDRPERSDRKPYGSKPAYGERSDRKPYGSKPAYGERSERKPYGSKPAYGDRKPYAKRDDKKSADGSYPKYDPARQIGEMRLNRFIAQSGLCSRREADDFIKAGLVSVNGVVVTELGSKVMPTDEVKFNDSRVQGEKKVYLVLNKPKGYVTSNDDPHADKTVMDLVREACTERIYPVGRLDKNSVGLLLFTNDGDMTKQLTHPSYRKKKIYQVSLNKPLTRADMDAIAAGVKLEDGDIYADEISYVKDDKSEVGIEIHSGRNRIVRRIFEHLGYTVQKLDRVYYAGLTKKNLKRGDWRFLTSEEVDRLKSGRYE